MTRRDDPSRSLPTPPAGAALAAYRAALDKVEPGEAFLARTRQAMAAAAAGELAGQAQPAGAGRRGLRGAVGRGPVWRGADGVRLPQLPHWPRLGRLLLPAACCALVLLAVPAAGLLRLGGAGSGAAASERYSFSSAAQAVEDADGAPPPAAEAAPEDAPEDSVVGGMAGGEGSTPAEDPAGANERKESGGTGAEGYDSAPSEEINGQEDAPRRDDAESGAPFTGFAGTGEPPAAALEALNAGEGWRDGVQGGYEPDGLRVLLWEHTTARLGGEVPEPAIRIWVSAADGEVFAVDLPEE